MKNRAATAAVAALTALTALGCSSDDPSTLIVTAGAGRGEADLELTVDGEVTAERITGSWEREVEVSGDFSASLTVTDADGGDGARCAIALEGVQPIEASGAPVATCRLSGSVSGGSSDVSGRSQTDTLPAAEAPAEAADEAADETTAETTVSTIEMVEGAFAADVADTWDVIDTGAPSVFGEEGLVDTREFDVDQTVGLVIAEHPDGSVFEIRHHRLPLSVPTPLEEIGEQLRDQIDPERQAETLALGVAEFAGFPAAEYTFQTDERVVQWKVFRVGTHLLAVVGVDRGESDVDDVLASMTVDPGALPPLSHSTRIGFPTLDGNPGIRLPADVTPIDDRTDCLESASLDFVACLVAVSDLPPLDDVVATAADDGFEATTIEIDGVTATVLERALDDEIVRQILLPVEADGVVVAYELVASADLAGVLDRIMFELTS